MHMFGKKDPFESFKRYVKELFNVILICINKGQKEECLGWLDELGAMRRMWATEAAGNFTGYASKFSLNKKRNLQQQAQQRVDFIEETIESARSRIGEKGWL